MAKRRTRRNSTPERGVRRVGKSVARGRRNYKRDAKGRFARTGGSKGRGGVKGALRKSRQRRAIAYQARAGYRSASDEIYVRQTGDRGSAKDRARLARRNSRDYGRAAKLQSKVDGKRVTVKHLHQRADKNVTRQVRRAMASGRA